jgi:superfamily II DNA or RNA helicase
MVTEYPWQIRFAERWDLTAFPQRILVSSPTGSGKTLAAVKAFEGFESVLICGEGLALEAWQRELGTENVARLTEGPRKGQSKKKVAAIQAALASRIIFATPGIWQKWWDKLPPARRRLLVLDEAHMFDAPDTLRSVSLVEWSKAKNLAMLALTATYVRKEIRDVWSLANIFNPMEFRGQTHTPESTRIVPFQFLMKYCQRDPEMGFFHGAKLDALPELKARLATFVEFVEPAEILNTAPKAQISLSASPQHDIAEEIVNASAGSRCLMFQHVDIATAFASRYGWPVFHSGNSTTEQRVAALAKMRDAYARGEEVAFVGTWGSFNVGVSLAWVERTAIFEPPTTPGQLEQLMGRFQRPEAAQRVPACIVVEASPRALKRLQSLKARAETSNLIQGNSDRVSGLIQKVKDRALAPEILSVVADYDEDLEFALRYLEGDEDQSDD